MLKVTSSSSYNMFGSEFNCHQDLSQSQNQEVLKSGASAHRKYTCLLLSFSYKILSNYGIVYKIGEKTHGKKSQTNEIQVFQKEQQENSRL